MKHKLSGDGTTREVYLDGQYLDPGPSQKYHNHSPDGFSWGYGGSGPSQLALAIILKITGKPDGYQDFKWNYITRLPNGNSFDEEFDLIEIMDEQWLNQYDHDRVKPEMNG